MTSIAFSRQRIRLIKAAKSAFAAAGWSVVAPSEDSHDFRVSCGKLLFFIKCVDETKILYESVASLIEKLDNNARVFRNFGNRQMVIVFERDFLSIDLDSLIDKNIFAFLLDDISTVTSLARFSDCIPVELNSKQSYLLKRSVEYGIFVSELYYKERNFLAAIEWGQSAVRYSAGYSRAYPWLFQVLRDAGDLEAAAELGEKIALFRLDDPQFLHGMEALARKRGKSAEAVEWRRRLTELPTTPRTLTDILAKQRAQNLGTSSSSGAVPVQHAPPSERGLSRLFKVFRRN